MNLIDKISELSTAKKLILLFMLALTLRFLSYYTHPYIHSDSVTYLSINYHDSKGELQKGLDLHRQLPPAILYFMRIFSTLGINVEFGYRFVSVLLYSLVIFPLFYIAKQCVSENASLFTVFCYVCHTKAIGYSHAVLRESLAIPFMIFGLALLFFAYNNRKPVYATLAGIGITISYMSRLEYGIAFIFGLFLFCIFILWGKINDQNNKRRYYFYSFLTLLTMLPILILVNIDMQRHNSLWDPFAYRKVKGFVMRTFSE